MIGKENPIQLATRIFDESIYGIRDSDIPGVNDAARRTVDRIRNREIFVVANNQTFNIPTVTGFDLAAVPGPQSMYAPVVVMDLGKVLGSRSELIKGDLVRTIAIADQYPVNGFQRRYKEVYTTALEAQTNWLETTRTPTVPLDPRTTDREALLRTLLGDARYFSDVGFQDWQKAIEDYRKSDMDTSVDPLLDQLKDATGHFMVMRQRFVPMNHRIALRKNRGEYLKWNAEKRTEAVAYMLIGASLYARQPNN
jgi:hypothetical protein